jgi:hypothetical protein
MIMTFRNTLSALASVLLAYGAIACAASDGGESAADTTGVRDVRITLERHACFGRCPIYKLEIDETGKVVYEGLGFVKTNGRQEATIPARDVQALAKEIEDAGYFGFRANYPPDATDHPIVVTSVTIDGRTSRVEHNLGSRTAPAVLDSLYRRIDDVAGTARWVGEQQTGAPVKGGGS